MFTCHLGLWLGWQILLNLQNQVFGLGETSRLTTSQSALRRWLYRRAPRRLQLFNFRCETRLDYVTQCVSRHRSCDNRQSTRAHWWKHKQAVRDVWRSMNCDTRFNKICHPSQRPRWQVDKEAIGLSRVQQCSSTYNPPS